MASSLSIRTKAPDVKKKMSTIVFIMSLALASFTGCSMTDNDSSEVPFAGTSTSYDAADAVEEVSSDLYNLIGVKGKASDSRAGVMDCSDKDRETYFRIFHPWSFQPASVSDLGAVMERLKAELPKRGWKIVSYGPDTSKNRNINLVADNDEKKVSVKIVEMAKDDPPMLSLDIVSGCYKVPDGKKVERF
ncbi:hypothetical protein ACIBAI_04490 [Streptomyces sp. NPDC051041]|uniref:hypothetical protein n=1 Tax=Streptomyces sp. NPDC051041 TaxID=3365640 RepID=UPI003794C783